MRDIGNKNVIAMNIKHYMRIKDISAKELSNAIKVPYTTVLSWINAEYYPRIDKIEKMSDFFGCLKSDLIEDKTGKTIDLPISELTPHEQKVLTQYRAKTHLQEAVDKLLDVPTETLPLSDEIQKDIAQELESISATAKSNIPK